MNWTASLSRSRSNRIIVESRSFVGFIGEINGCIIITNDDSKGYQTIFSFHYPIFTMVNTEIELPGTSSLLLTQGSGKLANILEVSFKNKHMLIKPPLPLTKRIIRRKTCAVSCLHML